MTQDAVGLLKEHLNLVEIVGRYAKLQKRGNRVLANCPLHQEKTPSFHIDVQKGLYHCFGCGSGGDLIRFVQEMENLSFPETLDFLAEIAGIELPKNRGRGPSRDLIDQLRAINEEAVKFFQNQLANQADKGRYLKERGLKDSTIKLFRIGYADHRWDGLYQHLTGQFDPNILMQSGLFKMGKKGTPYDIFRERIIFPITDAFGHVVAFGGRLLPGQEGPKYINSPESPLYTKGKHLYNLNFAKPYLKREPTAVVVEGYMDVIQVYQSGVGGVIASLGTAFTDGQAKLLKRYSEKAILNFDGDRAGFKAARASIETFLKIDLDVGVVRLPDNLDPDDYLREHGVKAYREQLENAGNFFEFLTIHLGENGAFREDPHLRSVLIQELCLSLRHISDPVVRNFYLDKASEDLDVPRHVVEQVFKRQAAPAPEPVLPRNLEPEEKPTVNFTHIEQKFVYLNMHQVALEDHLDQEQRETLPKILNSVFRNQSWILEFLYTDLKVDLQKRLEVVPEALRPHLLEIFFTEGFQATDPEEIRFLYFDLLKTMFEKLQARNRRLLSQLDPSDDARRREILQQNFRYRKEMSKLEVLIRSGEI